MKRLLSILITTSMFGFGATAFAQVVDENADRFKPRIYGSLSASDKGAGVIKAQHSPIQLSDLSEEEYQKLLDEAKRVKTYQSYTNGNSQSPMTQAAQNPQYQSSPYSPESQSQLATPAPTTTVVSNTTLIHNVVKGDTLYNISKRYDVSIADIQAANGLNGSAISLGQSLILPTQVKILSSNQPTTQYFSSSQSYSGGVNRVIQPVGAETSTVYAVLPKDTIYGISRRTCTSVEAIVSTNGIENQDSLKPGQRLILPSGHCLTR